MHSGHYLSLSPSKNLLKEALESSVRSGFGAGFQEVGAVGRAPVSAVGYLESDRRQRYSSLRDRSRTGVVQRFEQITGGCYVARPKEARVADYQGYAGYPRTLYVPTWPW